MSKQQKSKAPAKKAALATAVGASPQTTVEVKPKARVKAAPKPTREKREPKPKEDDLVVFAIRLTRDERDAVHAAAGPARATKLIRSVAIAAAHGDLDAFKRAVKEAEEARAKSKK